jgi:RNA-directed DNA polymerase
MSHLEAVLGYSREDIRWLMGSGDALRYTFHKKKSATSKREISPSLLELKDVQNRLQDRVFSNVKFPWRIVGSVKKRDGVLNARLHSGLLYHLKLDVFKFFDFVTYRHVDEALRGLGFSKLIAETITKLVTYKGHVPQGASTSAFIANLVGLKIDQKMIQICGGRDIIYTRYVDDMLFSSNADFQDLMPVILEALRSLGFKHNEGKVCYKLGDIEVTGAITGCNGLRPTEATSEKYMWATSEAVKAGCEGHFKYVSRINNMSVAEYKERFAELQFPEKIILRPKAKIITPALSSGPAMM